MPRTFGSGKPLSLVAILLGFAACKAAETTGPSGIPSAEVASLRAPETTEFQTPYFFDHQCTQGYLLTNSGVASGHQTIFFNADGTPVRSALHLALRGTLTNSSSGESLPSSSNFTILTDLVTGASSISGAQFHITDQGQGVIVLDAGTIRFDPVGQVIFQGGRHDFTDADFEAAECAALS